jgi:hypothetical protein
MKHPLAAGMVRVNFSPAEAFGWAAHVDAMTHERALSAQKRAEAQALLEDADRLVEQAKKRHARLLELITGRTGHALPEDPRVQVSEDGLLAWIDVPAQKRAPADVRLEPEPQVEDPRVVDARLEGTEDRTAT